MPSQKISKETWVALKERAAQYSEDSEYVAQFIVSDSAIEYKHHQEDRIGYLVYTKGRLELRADKYPEQLDAMWDLLDAILKFNSAA